MATKYNIYFDFVFRARPQDDSGSPKEKLSDFEYMD